MEVLIIGNGFDLAHDLKTQYSDFLPVMKDPDAFVDAIIKMKDGKIYPEPWERYNHPNIGDANVDKLKSMAGILKNNVWADYYRNCEADIQGWIDFENEMFPVFSLLQEVFQSCENATIRLDDDIPVLTLDLASYEAARKAKLIPKYFYKVNGQRIVIKGKEFVGYHYGLSKNKILEDLKDELDKFIETFRIYLEEVVCTQKIQTKALINRMHPDAVVSFNYTNTELQYPYLRGVHNFHVHGNVNKDNSMALGVNKVDTDPDNDFVYFLKYFQRIRRGINQEYKSLIDWDAEKELHVSFYGHSLSVTDEDIIKPFVEKSNKVTIYCYGQKDYEQKVINLIKLFNRDIIEDDLYRGRIAIIDTKMSSSHS